LAKSKSCIPKNIPSPMALKKAIIWITKEVLLMPFSKWKPFA